MHTIERESWKKLREEENRKVKNLKIKPRKKRKEKIYRVISLLFKIKYFYLLSPKFS